MGSTEIDARLFDAAAAVDGGLDASLSADAPFDAPQPEFDCDDPAFWSAPPARRFTLRGLPVSSCYPDIPSLVVRVPLHGWGYGAFCFRVHASDRADVPIGVTRIPRTGATLGLAAPAEVDLEIRQWTYSEGEGWVLVSERGPASIDPPPPFRLVVPPVGPLGRDVTHLVGDFVVSASDVVARSRGLRRSHGPLIAVGRIGGRLAWIRDESPPVLEILSDDVTVLAEHVWDGPFDATRTAVLPFGVLSADRLMVVDGVDVEMRSLPVVMDEARAWDEGAVARSGEQGYRFDARGRLTPGPSGVAHVVNGGAFLSADRRLVGMMGPIGSPIDPAIGEVLAWSTYWPHAHALGEHGIALQPFDADDLILGTRTILFDPGSVAIRSEPGAVVVRQSDGSFVAHWFPNLDSVCE